MRILLHTVVHYKGGSSSLVDARELRGVLAAQLVANRAGFSVGLLGLRRVTLLEVLESQVEMSDSVMRVQFHRFPVVLDGSGGVTQFRSRCVLRPIQDES